MKPSPTLNLTLQRERAIINTQKARKASKTRKGTTMKNTITRVDALNFAIDCIQSAPACSESRGDGEIAKIVEEVRGHEIVEVLTKIRDQIAKSHTSSDKSKAKAKEKRAIARAELMKQVLPVVRDAIGDGGTAKEIFERCSDKLPDDFTSAKVQYILLHELANEVNKVEAKNKPNVYTKR